MFARVIDMRGEGDCAPGSISRAASISSRWALIDGAVSAAVAEVQESCEWWEWRWSRWCFTTRE